VGVPSLLEGGVDSRRCDAAKGEGGGCAPVALSPFAQPSDETRAASTQRSSNRLNPRDPVVSNLKA
jgi:hypothetical protein